MHPSQKQPLTFRPEETLGSVSRSQTGVLDRCEDTLVKIGKCPELWKTVLGLALTPWPSGASRALTGVSF